MAHAQSMVPHLRTYSYAQAPSTGSSWQQILRALDCDPKELITKPHPSYQANIRGREFDIECWVKVIKNNPDLLKAPIAMRGSRAILCKTPTDIYKLTELVRVL
mgnify:FL=1